MALGGFRAIVKNCVENGLKEENVRLIVSDLETTNAEFLDFIQSIGPGLTDPDGNIRLNATKLLSDVVSKLKASFFNQNEVEVLLDFFCAKFTDNFLIAPASLKGFAALAQAEALSSSAMKSTIRSIFRDLTVQTLDYNGRSLIYSVFDFFIRVHLEVLKEMNGEFVIGFTQMVESERDPRNLLLIFSMISTIASDVPLGAVAQDLFELLSEYFPIDFAPGSNYEWRITRDDLSTALKTCFTSSTEFADFSLPLLLEKMSSDLVASKMDSLDYLTACCETYDSDKIAEFSDRIWAMIRRDMFSSETDVEAKCLLALVAMARNLSKEGGNEKQPTTAAAQGENQNLIHFLDSIFKDCSRYLQETSLKIFHQSIKILHQVTFASRQSCEHLLGKNVDALIKEFDIQKQATPRTHIVRSLLMFIDSNKIPQFEDCSTNDDDIKCIAEIRQAILMSRKEKILDIVFTVGKNQSPDLLSLSAWGSVVLISSGYFTEEEKKCIAEHLAELAISATKDAVRKSALGSLESLSVVRKDLCVELVLPKLLSSLTSELKSPECDVGKVEHLVMSVAHISLGKELFTRASSELFKIISETGSRSHGMLIISSCIGGLSHLVKSNLESETMDFLTSRFVRDCRDAMFGISRESPLKNSTKLGGCDDGVERLVEEFASCIRIVVEKSDLGSVVTFIEEIVSIFFENLKQIHAEDAGEVSTTNKPCLNTVLHLLLATVCVVKNQEQVKDVEQVMQLCSEVARSARDFQTSLVASKCFAALINKTLQCDFLEDMIERTEDELLSILSKEGEGNVELLKKSCFLWGWVTKALVARNHGKQMIFANQMVDMLSSPRLSQHSSEGFRNVLSDFDEVLSSTSNSNITLMYKQRFFALTIYRLTDAFHLCMPELKKHFLEAMSHMNRFVPKQVIHQELKLILPLLIQSLDKNDTPDIWMPSLSALQSFIVSSPDEIGKYLDDITPRLLDLSRYPEKMVVRIEALKCLTLLPEHLPPILLLPRQVEVIQRITHSLSDHKRLVRQQASLAKCAWHHISQPTQNDGFDRE